MLHRIIQHLVKTIKEIKVSQTDSESVYYHRDEKKNGFMYLDNRTVDSKCNIIMDCHITKGNVHDSTPYISRLEYIKDKYGFIAYRRYAKAETTVKKNRFKYIKGLDGYVCPETNVTLDYTGRIDRNGINIIVIRKIVMVAIIKKFAVENKLFGAFM